MSGATVDMDDVRELVKLTHRKRVLEDKTEETKASIAEVEERLLSQFIEAGTQKVTEAESGCTVWLDRKLWASCGGNVPAVAEALREAGLEDLVTDAVNAQRLTSWVREHDPDKRLSPEQVLEQLPEKVAALVKVSEVYKLGVRKSK